MRSDFIKEFGDETISLRELPVYARILSWLTEQDNRMERACPAPTKRIYMTGQKFLFSQQLRLEDHDDERSYRIVDAVRDKAQSIMMMNEYCHSYTGKVHPVKDWQHITEEEFSAICGGHPEWFIPVEEA